MIDYFHIIGKYQYWMGTQRYGHTAKLGQFLRQFLQGFLPSVSRSLCGRILYLSLLGVSQIGAISALQGQSNCIAIIQRGADAI